MGALNDLDWELGKLRDRRIDELNRRVHDLECLVGDLALAVEQLQQRAGDQEGQQ